MPATLQVLLGNARKKGGKFYFGQKIGMVPATIFESAFPIYLMIIAATGKMRPVKRVRRFRGSLGKSAGMSRMAFVDALLSYAKRWWTRSIRIPLIFWLSFQKQFCFNAHYEY
jgi:hypothetical protein